MDRQDFKVDIHLFPNLNRLFKSFFIDCDSQGLVSIVLFEEGSLGDDCVPHLDVPEVGLRIDDLVFELLKFGLVIKLSLHSNIF